MAPISQVAVAVGFFAVLALSIGRGEGQRGTTAGPPFPVPYTPSSSFYPPDDERMRLKVYLAYGENGRLELAGSDATLVPVERNSLERSRFSRSRRRKSRARERQSESCRGKCVNILSCMFAGGRSSGLAIGCPSALDVCCVTPTAERPRGPPRPQRGEELRRPRRHRGESGRSLRFGNGRKNRRRPRGRLVLPLPRFPESISYSAVAAASGQPAESEFRSQEDVRF